MKKWIGSRPYGRLIDVRDSLDPKSGKRKQSETFRTGIPRGARKGRQVLVSWAFVAFVMHERYRQEAVVEVVWVIS
jgi:hypothetical protein